MRLIKRKHKTFFFIKIFTAWKTFNSANVDFKMANLLGVVGEGDGQECPYFLILHIKLLQNFPALEVVGLRWLNLAEKEKRGRKIPEKFDQQ